MRKFGMYFLMASLIGLLSIVVGCDDSDSTIDPITPDTATQARIDRFSADAGTLFVRDGTNGLPGVDEPIRFDQPPFITMGLGPQGERVKYYDFDVHPTTSAPIFALFREGSDTPVEGQLNIIDVIPGDDHYSDFWHVHKVTVPADYEANTITSIDALMDSGYPIERTDLIVNCPVVPAGSTAMLRYDDGDTGLIRGWYKDMVVHYFDFSEKILTVTPPPEGHPEVPLSDIYVAFNINPDQPGGGPLSGFMTEPGTSQTHNVVETLPEDMDYSPFWDVDVYDNADFHRVYDLVSAQSAMILATGVALVNCPIVSVDEEGVVRNPDTAPQAAIDRFSAEAGTLFVRDGNNGLPEADEPIDFDQAPFLTQGLGPAGEIVQYYNFDVHPTTSAPIFAFFREGSDTPVEGQLNIIDVIPGDDHYSDFWHVHKVTVPMDYRVNSITNLDALMSSGYPIERTNLIVNCPVVPEGSTAMRRYNNGDTGLIRGWYKDMVVHYFDFSEKTLTVPLPPEGHPEVPLSDIFVTFNMNPDLPGGGPPSGFMTEPGTRQTHNVVETLPEDMDYSPFWDVDIYDNAFFDQVTDLASAQMADILATGAALVNCPIVSIQ